jgi:hypothetical protein
MNEVKGLRTYWISDINKAFIKINDLRKSIEKIKFNPLIKKDILEDIDKLLDIMGRGKNAK